MEVDSAVEEADVVAVSEEVEVVRAAVGNVQLKLQLGPQVEVEVDMEVEEADVVAVEVVMVEVVMVEEGRKQLQLQLEPRVDKEVDIAVEEAADKAKL